MSTLDETKLRELVIKGEKVRAVELVMQQMNIGLRDAKAYVDEYCLQEKIGDSFSGPTYSAVNVRGSITYYKTENGTRYSISKEEAPEFLVNKMENTTNGREKK